jgi:hypothetical protein
MHKDIEFRVGEWVNIDTPEEPGTNRVISAKVVAIKETVDGVEYTMQRFPFPGSIPGKIDHA